MRAYTVSGPMAEAIDVTGENWLVALGRAVASVGGDEPSRLACEVLANGTVIAREPGGRGSWVVQPLRDVVLSIPPLDEDDLEVLPIEALDPMDPVDADRILQAATIEEASAMAVEMAVAATGVESGALLLDSGGYLRFVAAVGPVSRQVLGVRVPRGAGVAGVAFERGLTIAVGDARADARHYREVDEWTGYQTRGLLAVPVRMGERVIGVLELINPQGPGGLGRDVVTTAGRVAAALGRRLAMGRSGGMIDAGWPSARALFGLGLGTVVVLAVVLGTGQSVVVVDVPADVFVPLDAGWRWAQGQWPHLNYQTPVGAAYALAYGLPMRWVGPDPRVILWVPAALAAPIFLLLHALGRSRWSGPWPSAVAAVLALGVLSPLHLDSGRIAHLASYNRVGWALAAGLCLLALPPRHGVSAWREGAVAVGLLAALFWIKITYLLFGVGALGVVVLTEPGRRRWALVTLVVAAAVVGAMASTPLGTAYLSDLRATASSWDPSIALQNDRTPGIDKGMAILKANGGPLVLCLAGALLATRLAPAGRAVDVDLARVLILVGGQLGVAVQSHDHHLPTLWVPTVAVASLVETLHLRSPIARVGRAMLGLALVLTAGERAWGVVAHRALADGTTEGRPVTDRGPMARLRFVGHPVPGPGGRSRLGAVLAGEASWQEAAILGIDDDALDVADAVRDGVEGLARLPDGAPRRVFALWFSQPFAVVTGRPPPRGLRSWYDAGRTYGGANPLGAHHLDDVDVVMVGRTEVVDFDQGSPMWREIGPLVEGWERHRSPGGYWTLYVRPTEAARR